MSEWQPLSSIWDIYNESLEEATNRGFLNDEELAEEYVWPVDLNFGDWEQQDVRKYVHERMMEIVDQIQTRGGVTPNLVAAYIFRSVLVGMLWEKERIGK